MIWKKMLTSIAAMSLIILSACNLQFAGPPSGNDAPPATEQTMGEQTRLAIALAGTLTAMVPTVPVSTPTPSLTPTSPFTPTPAVPMVSVSQDTNCRTGPGLPYDMIGTLIVGKSAEVVGKDAYGQYWIIKNPLGPGNCWLWGKYATVTGDTSKLPVIAAPPSPTPIPAVTNVTVALSKPSIQGICNYTGFGKSQGVTLTITTNGPTTVHYKAWVYTPQGVDAASTDGTLSFSAAGTKSTSFTMGFFGVNGGCGTWVVKVYIDTPNIMTAQATFQGVP